MVPSRLAEARRRPSGLNATHPTHVGVSAEVEHLPAGRRLPDVHRLVFAGRGEAQAVGAAEGDAEDESVVPPRERAEALAGRRVPHVSGVRSKLAEASRRPSGLNASALTGWRCSERVWRRSPVAASQIFTCPASSPTRGAARRD